MPAKSSVGMAPQGFVSVLEARLRADGYAARVINAGVPGDTSGQGAARLGSALTAKADMAIVEFGANDLFKRVDLQVLRENLERIVAAFRAGGTRVLLAGLRKSDGPASQQMPALDAIYPDIARKYSIALDPYFLYPIVAGGRGEKRQRYAGNQDGDADRRFDRAQGGAEFTRGRRA